MSPSSNGDSPHSATATMTTSATIARQFPLPNRDFSVDIPSPQLAAGPNGANSLKSPNSLKAAAAARTPSFSREGILGSAQKARNLSQSSDNRPDSVSNGIPKSTSEESINPLKRRNTDAAVDYPRRRATIAVGGTAMERRACADWLVVRSVSLEKVAMRRYKTEVQALHGARCRVHLPGAWHQVGRWG
jgi:hypothetical protein